MSTSDVAQVQFRIRIENGLGLSQPKLSSREMD